MGEIGDKEGRKFKEKREGIKVERTMGEGEGKKVEGSGEENGKVNGVESKRKCKGREGEKMKETREKESVDNRKEILKGGAGGKGRELKLRDNGNKKLHTACLNINDSFKLRENYEVFFIIIN